MYQILADYCFREINLSLSLIAFCVFALWLWCRRPVNDSPPQYPGGLPLIGNSLQFLGDSTSLWKVFQSMINFSNERGGVVSLKIGTYQIYAITDPDDYQTVANTCLDKSKLFYEYAEPWLDVGLITAKSHTWKNHRKLLNPAFSQQMLNIFEDIFNSQARKLVATCKPKAGAGAFDPEPILKLNVLEASYQATFNITPDRQEIDEYIENITILLNSTSEIIQKFWLQIPFIFKWSSLKKKRDMYFKRMTDISSAIICKRRSELLQSGAFDRNSNSVTDKCQTLLDRLLHLAAEQDLFTDKDLRQHLDTIIVASYDTSVSTLIFASIILGSYPDVQEQVYKEIKDLLGDSDRNINRHDLSQLVYLDAVLKEVMRWYSVAPIVARSITQDVKLKNYILPANTQCFLAIHGVHHHPMWGPDADQFRPERWLEPGGVPDNPNAFAAFSIGRRSCIGKYYAMISIKTTLVHLIRSYRITADISKVVNMWDVTIKPVSGSEIVLELRE